MNHRNQRREGGDYIDKPRIDCEEGTYGVSDYDDKHLCAIPYPRIATASSLHHIESCDSYGCYYLRNDPAYPDFQSDRSRHGESRIAVQGKSDAAF